MQFWGFSWVAYSLSLFSLLLFVMSGNDLFLEIRKIVDMFNLLLLLFGTSAFIYRPALSVSLTDNVLSIEQTRLFRSLIAVS